MSSSVFRIWTVLSITLALVSISLAAEPGTLPPPTAALSGQKTGSVLFYNYYSSKLSNPANDTELSITNNSDSVGATVRFFFVSSATGRAREVTVCLMARQTAVLLASQVDPATYGYVLAVAVNSTTGCPLSHNFLAGSAHVKLATGHTARLPATALAALYAGTATSCMPGAATTTIAFDGNSYNQVPRTLTLDKIYSPADGNETLFILNRVGGNLVAGVNPLGNLTGMLFNDVASSQPFTLTANAAQFQSLLSNSFPLTATPFASFLPAGRSGWLKVYDASNDVGLLGAALQFNRNAGTQLRAFTGGQNLRALTLSASNSYTLPLSQPTCSSTFLTCVSIEPRSQFFNKNGGSGSVSVTANGCSTTTSSNANWLTITAQPDGGFNDGVVAYSVAANPTTAARSGTLTIGGNEFTVTQTANVIPIPMITASAPAVPLPSASEQSLTIGGTDFQAALTVTLTAPNGLTTTLSGPKIQSLTATSFTLMASLNSAGRWSIRVNHPDGAQSNTFSFLVIPPCNATAITPGQVVNGTLSASDCLSLARAGSTYTDQYSFSGLAGQRITILLTSTAFDPYLALLGPDGSVIASVDDYGESLDARIPLAAPLLTLPSNGTYVIETTSSYAGASGTYVLSFNACSYAVAPTTAAFTSAGGTGGFSVTANPDCTWGTTSNAAWLTTTGGSGNGNGNGTVTYSVAPSNLAGSRTGTITVSDAVRSAVFTVTQAGTGCPAVSSLNPTSGRPGATVTITGNSLAFVAGIKFPNNLDAAFTVLSNSQISVTVPNGALSGSLTILRSGCSDVPTPLFNVLYTVAGKVLYGLDPTKLIPATVLQATGASPQTATSGADGSYSLALPNAVPYTITPTKTGQTNGISAFDAALITRHLAGRISLTSAQQMAADVDNSGGILSLNDAQLIAQTVVGKANGSNASSWKFVPPSRVYSTVSADQTSQNFEAILAGEVSGNWQPPAALAVTAVTPMTTEARGQGLSVRVSGGNFQPGLKVILVFPDGVEAMLSEAQVREVTTNSFVLTLPRGLNQKMLARILNPDGSQSQPFTVRQDQ